MARMRLVTGCYKARRVPPSMQAPQRPSQGATSFASDIRGQTDMLGPTATQWMTGRLQESLNHATHCRQVPSRIPRLAIQGLDERGPRRKQERQRVVARNRG